MAYSVRDSALRLLDSMNYHEAQGRTNAVVGLDPPVVHDAGLQYGSDLLDNAMWWLLDEGALRRDYEMDAATSNVLEVPDYGVHFYITEHGFDLLRGAR